LKYAKRYAIRVLFLLVLSSLVAAWAIAPAAAASSSSGGSNAQSLNGASAPHTYIDFKGSWGADTAANLAKYDVVALHYTDTAQHVQAIKGINPNTVILAYFNPGYVDALDGWMDEGFPFYKGWDNSIGFALDAANKGKLILFYAQGSASDRYFCYCSALLTDGYFFYAPTGTKWFDDYGIQLGTALSKAEKNADGTWQRAYQYGTVVVNPSSKTAHIDLKSGQSTTAI